MRLFEVRFQTAHTESFIATRLVRLSGEFCSVHAGWWLLLCDKRAQEVFEFLFPLLGDNSQLLVSEVYEMVGWMPTQNALWLRDALKEIRDSKDRDTILEILRKRQSSTL